MKLVFVHIPRTGGLSLMRAVYDKEVRGAQLIRAAAKKGVRVIGHNTRMPNYQYLKDYLKQPGATERKSLFIFTFVRNPWDRAVSSFFYLNQGGNNSADDKDRIKYIEKYKGDFKLFVQQTYLDQRIFKQMHFKPQHEWICDEQGNILVDFIGRFENYQDDLEKLSQLTNFDFHKIRHLNKSQHSHFNKYYDEETKEIIRNAYHKDIQLFNYEF